MARLDPRIKKPPYRVPTMMEIAALPKNGYVVVSTFSGCGGSCLGFEMAGYTVLWANEFIPAARDTYRLNHPAVMLDDSDIRKVDPAKILEQIGMNRGDVDVLEGSPPCASFSTAGKREKHWGDVKKYSDTKQRTDDLFFQFVRILDGIKPKVFVAENVSGLVKGTAKGYFLDILKALKGVGYRVEARLVDAQWLGVPQGRQRIIFVGTRNDLPVRPAHPSPFKYRYAVKDACPWIQKIDHVMGGFQGTRVINGDEPIDTIRAGVGVSTSQAQRAYQVTSLPIDPDAWIRTNAIGGEWDKLGVGQQSDKYFNLVKIDPEGPCPAVLAIHGSAGTASITHPFERRKLSIAELRRLCSFPDDFQLTGKYAQQWERLGRAVPPLMMRAIAQTVKEEILDKLAE